MLDYEDDYFLEEDKMPKPSLKTNDKSGGDGGGKEAGGEVGKPTTSQRETEGKGMGALIDIECLGSDITTKESGDQGLDSKCIGVEEAAVKRVEDDMEGIPPLQLEEEDEEELDEEGERHLLFLSYQDKMGMTVTSGSVKLNKDGSNMIGISIGGGAPLCPCLYIVQVFDDTPAAKEGSLQSGDELVGVNGQSVKGKTKVEVARMIQATKDEVTIQYNKLHPPGSSGSGVSGPRSLDLALKKAKHRLVEGMSSATADALGLSRAILCNDSLLRRLGHLTRTQETYEGMLRHTRALLNATIHLLHIYKAFGDTFSAMGVREPQARASEAFRQFGEHHRQMEKIGMAMVKEVRPILSDLGTYLHKAIPDTRLTIRKYADAKFEYLSYCLKVKEMDDEESSHAALQEPLYRVETGNYEYRLILRCRQEARARFARLRGDVLVKLELLDSKRAQDSVLQLGRLAAALARFHARALAVLDPAGPDGEPIYRTPLFPVDVDLQRTAFTYKSVGEDVMGKGIEKGMDEEEDIEEEGDLAKNLTQLDIKSTIDTEDGIDALKAEEEKGDDANLLGQLDD
ncbi:PRKCA-binding protein isoform X2 [Ischnura elegans]|uniref:PRKCA-binding protein isoform X2 n=1 Tax=Ischnura elegans TaxID=197161 RepID=UPI001ED8B0F9|nr:PRKCA-binding protein isoform X2 [Ischnura elegans]